MQARINSRGTLPSTAIQPLSYIPRPLSNLFLPDSRRSSMNTLQKPRKDICYDWIFSSSSNVHVAIDRASFMSYQPFECFALTLSDQSRIPVRGIGTVELRIRCKAGSRSHRPILLENVLHIPEWLCNIFSDIYFQQFDGFDFAWNEFGVSFSTQYGGKAKPCGYTENFCGLDRLVLARKQEGRSPMMDDPLREVFSVNLTWPQSQIDKWEDWVLAQTGRQTDKRTMIGDAVVQQQNDDQFRSLSNEKQGAVGLVKRLPSERVSSLRATVSMRSLSQFARKLI